MKSKETLMWGKAFRSLYTGSMINSAPENFLVWNYIIANTDLKSHLIELNPKILAFIFNVEVEKIEKAIDYLSSPDLSSRSKDYEGRRIIKTEHCNGLQWFVTGHERYQNEGVRDPRESEDTAARVRKHRESKRAIESKIDTNTNIQIDYCVKAPRDCANEQNAIAIAKRNGIDEQFAISIWQQIEGRGYRDGGGNPVFNFAPHLKKRWFNESCEWEAKQKKQIPKNPLARDPKLDQMD
jgi:hypothetical protein